MTADNDIAEKRSVPKHVAIIMDGNGRWAKKRGLPRTLGHRRGADSVRESVRAAAELGVEYLTLFGFSTENWKRPEDEVGELVRLLRVYLRSETAELHKNNVVIRVIGNRDSFGKEIVKLIDNAENLTKDNEGLNLTIALDYGGRKDILEATREIARQVADGTLDPDDLTEDQFGRFLSTKDMPPPDILIRTGGEQRVSNFLLWQCAYAELIFIDKFWPDFDKKMFEQAISEYGRRDRRFGALSA